MTTQLLRMEVIGRHVRMAVKRAKGGTTRRTMRTSVVFGLNTEVLQ
jgi:hypothetical protein